MATIQIVRFRLNDGVNAQDFRALNERFQREAAPKLPGLVRREGSVNAEGEWLLVLRYTDLASAQQANKTDIGELAQLFMSQINMSTMSAGFYEITSE